MRTQYQNLDRFREHVGDLIAHLPASKGLVDLQPLFFCLTMDTTTALLLGRSIRSLRADEDGDSENKAFAEDFNVAQEGLAARFRITPWHFFYNPPKFRRACANVHRFVEKYIRERRSSEKEPGATNGSFEFFDQLAQESANEKDLRDQILNVLLAGRDTTACALSWTLYGLAPFHLKEDTLTVRSRLLVRHPEVIDRLRVEISSVMGDAEYPTREQIRQMPYLACIIKESTY